MLCRRMFRFCTKQTMEEIRRLDDLDREGLQIFDLPIPVAIVVVLIWIFICSATFCIWESEWSYFQAFYFFFISLSTIGLGDITPQKPKMMLMMFFYIIIGLSLVSMCVNLIQIKLESTYEKGKEQIDLQEEFTNWSEARLAARRQSLTKRKRTTLGVLQSDSNYSMSSSQPESKSTSSSAPLPKPCHKLVQTLISFPSPRTNFREPPGNFPTMGTKLLPTSASVDDVMKLVNAHENDMVVLSEMSEHIEADSTASVRDIHAHIDNLPAIDEEGAPGPYLPHASNRLSRGEVIQGILKSRLSISHGAVVPEVSFRSPVVSPPSPIKRKSKSVIEGSPVRRFMRDSSEETLSLIENEKTEAFS